MSAAFPNAAAANSLPVPVSPNRTDTGVRLLANETGGRFKSARPQRVPAAQRVRATSGSCSSPSESRGRRARGEESDEGFAESTGYAPSTPVQPRGPICVAAPVSSTRRLDSGRAICPDIGGALLFPAATGEPAPFSHAVCPYHRHAPPASPPAYPVPDCASQQPTPAPGTPHRFQTANAFLQCLPPRFLCLAALALAHMTSP